MTVHLDVRPPLFGNCFFLKHSPLCVCVCFFFFPMHMNPLTKGYPSPKTTSAGFPAWSEERASTVSWFNETLKFVRAHKRRTHKHTKYFQRHAMDDTDLNRPPGCQWRAVWSWHLLCQWQSASRRKFIRMVDFATQRKQSHMYIYDNVHVCWCSTHKNTRTLWHKLKTMKHMHTPSNEII